MKEEAAGYFIEIGKLIAAALGGSLPTYLAMREKAKSNRVAEQIANSEFWKKEVADIKSYTDGKISAMKADLDDCIKKHGQSKNN
jgi:hypothetical protein